MSFGGARAESDQSAFFWFFDNSNFEMGVKMVDACSFNDSFWVFVSGLTNQAFTVTIRDGVTLAERSYSNPLGTYPQTIGATDGATGFDCTTESDVRSGIATAADVARVLAAAPADPLAGLWSQASQGTAVAGTEDLVNALLTTEPPAVGMLLTSETGCTGTLVGCSSFLTAASCICGFGLTGAECAGHPELLTVDDKQVFLPHHGPQAVAAIAIHPDYQFGFGHDLALITLAEPVAGAASVPLVSGDTVADGQVATLVGFGAAGGTDVSFGLRRSGQAATAACAAVPDAAQVCVELAAPLGEPGSETGLCLRDEGAPLFVTQGGAAKLAGVGSGATGAACLPPSESFFADVAVDRAWIASAAGPDLGTSGCGAAPVGGGLSTTAGTTGLLAAGDDEDLFSFEIPPGTLTLTATLTGDLFGTLDGDLYVRFGAAPTIAEFDSASENPSTLESIRIDAPAPGTWYFLIRRFDGEGDYQFALGALAPSGEPTVCVADADTACHLGNRFQVEVDWTTADTAGSAQVMSFGGERASSDQSSFWWFFDPANFEMGVKMVDACSFTNSYWVFVSGLTNQAYDVRITDTHTSLFRIYRNPLGQYPQTIGATGAGDGFPCTPALTGGSATVLRSSRHTRGAPTGPRELTQRRSQE